MIIHILELIIVTIAGTIALKAYDIPKINNFRENVHPNHPSVKKFHRESFIRRVIFGIVIAILGILVIKPISDLVFTGIICILIMWNVFNIYLALNRAGDFPWYYIGTESSIDKKIKAFTEFLNKKFNKSYKPGKVLLTVSAIIILLMIILIIIF